MAKGWDRENHTHYVSFTFNIKEYNFKILKKYAEFIFYFKYRKSGKVFPTLTMRTAQTVNKTIMFWAYLRAEVARQPDELQYQVAKL